MTGAVPLPLLLPGAVFLLAAVRASGMFLTAPFWSGLAAPPQLKVALALAIAACAAPLAPEQGPVALAALGSVPGLALAVAGELAVGFAIGMSGAVALAAIQTAGYLISQDIGLTIANVIDPITSIQTSVIGQLKVALALFVFVGLDFHHGIVRLISGSFRVLPVGTVPERLLAAAERLGSFGVSWGSALVDGAVRLAIPVSATLLLVTVAMAFLARAVPEMNVFILGFALRILVGFWVLILLVPLLAEAFRAMFERAARDGADALRVLAGGG